MELFFNALKILPSQAYKNHEKVSTARPCSFKWFFACGGVSFLQGVLHSSSLPDYIEVKKSGGEQQSNLFPVSAGNDVRMSTMRPNPYLSTGVEMRKSKFRGFFQLFSRPN